jgi:phenylalanyl-tRNA synthetase beta chain
MDFYDLKGIVESLIAGLHIEARIEPCEHSTYFPGRAACLKLKDQVIGIFGELHPLVAKAYDLPEDQPVLVAEIDLNPLTGAMDSLYEVAAFSTFPAVYEDIAVVVPESTPAAEVEAVIRLAGGYLLQDATLFDVYRGEQIVAGSKSLAYALTFQAPDKTLRDKDVSGVRTQIIRALAEKLKASVRE